MSHDNNAKLGSGVVGGCEQSQSKLLLGDYRAGDS